MNINPLLAILVLKKVITQDEAEQVAEFVHDKPQSTILSDVISQIKEFLPMDQPLVGGPAQQNEELRARDQNKQDEADAQKEARKTEKALEKGEAATADKTDDDKKPADDDKKK